VLVIIIGLVLLIGSAVFGLDLIWKNHYTIRSPALFGQTLGIHHAAELFIIGAIAGAVLLLGIAMMLAGLPRKAPGPSGTAPTARKPGTPAATATRPRRKTTSSAAGSTTTTALVPPAPPPPTRSRGTQVRTSS
jgi:hypothetical protein